MSVYILNVYFELLLSMSNPLSRVWWCHSNVPHYFTKCDCLFMLRLRLTLIRLKLTLVRLKWTLYLLLLTKPCEIMHRVVKKVMERKFSVTCWWSTCYIWNCNHVHNWHVSAQLSYTDTSLIWMRFKWTSRSYLNIQMWSVKLYTKETPVTPKRAVQWSF